MQKRTKREGEKEDYEFRMKLWNTYENHFLLRPCVDSVCNTIFSKGIAVSNASVQQRLSDHANALMVTDFLKFGRLIVESFMVQGFVVYMIAPAKGDEDYSVPVVVPPNKYEVTIEEDAYFRRKINVILKTDEESRVIKGTEVCCHNEFSSLSLRCISAVGSTIKYCTYLEHLELHDIEIQRMHANPPVLTVNKTDATFDSRDMTSGAIPGLRAQTEHENLAMRNKINVMQYSEQARLVSFLNVNRADTSSRAWEQYLEESDSEKSSVAFVPRFVPLPNDANIANFSLPPELKNINESRKQVCEIIATSMGVPLLALSSMGGTAQNTKNAENNAHALQRTSQMLSVSTRAALVDAFSKCFVESKNNFKINFPALDAHQEQ